LKSESNEHSLALRKKHRDGIQGNNLKNTEVAFDHFVNYSDVFVEDGLNIFNLIGNCRLELIPSVRSSLETGLSKRSTPAVTAGALDSNPGQTFGPFLLCPKRKQAHTDETRNRVKHRNYDFRGSDFIKSVCGGLFRVVQRRL
jgi:hypothetical protein